MVSYTMKLWEREIKRRLKWDIAISKNQFAFMRGRSTTKAIHLINCTRIRRISI